MTMSPNNGFGEARKREHYMMSLLADVACGRQNPDDLEGVDLLRQLGYSASLAKGRVSDPSGNLDRTVRLCRSKLEGMPTPVKKYRDRVQERWGAEWHMDPVKLRKELPLHVMKRARQDATQSPSMAF